jgi:hypothetical protein
MSLILFIVLLLLLFGGGVGWYGGRSGWGYAGWSPLGIIVVVVLVLFFAGALR